MALIEFELPCALVSTTETEVSGAALVPFAMVKGMVSKKLLPNAAEVGSAYQVVKTEDSEMVT